MSPQIRPRSLMIILMFLVGLLLPVGWMAALATATTPSMANQSPSLTPQATASPLLIRSSNAPLDVFCDGTRQPNTTLNPVTMSATEPFTETGTIDGTVFQDLNDNGVFDLGELGIGNCTCNLLDEEGNEIASTVTAVDGSYSFGALLPDTYTVELIVPDEATATSPSEVDVTVSPGENSEVNFGLIFFPTSIPTLSEWAFIAMAQLLLIVGTISITQSVQPMMLVGAAGDGTMLMAQPTNRGLAWFASFASFVRESFVPDLFIRVLAVVLVGTLIGSVIAIRGFGYVPEPADPFGSLLNAIIAAYMVHLWLLAGDSTSSRNPSSPEQ